MSLNMALSNFLHWVKPVGRIQKAMHVEQNEGSSLLTRFSGGEAQLLCQGLEAENIPFQMLDEQMSTLYGGNIILGGSRIMVPSKALNRIKEFMKEIRQEKKEI